MTRLLILMLIALVATGSAIGASNAREPRHQHFELNTPYYGYGLDVFQLPHVGWCVTATSDRGSSIYCTGSSQ